MKRRRVWVVLVIALSLAMQACAIPRTAGKAAVGVVKTTGKAVKATGRGIKNAVD